MMSEALETYIDFDVLLLESQSDALSRSDLLLN